MGGTQFTNGNTINLDTRIQIGYAGISIGIGIATGLIIGLILLCLRKPLADFTDAGSFETDTGLVRNEHPKGEDRQHSQERLKKDEMT